MEVNELLIPIIAGGICLAISIYGLAVAKDRFFALGGLFLYSFIPIIPVSYTHLTLPTKRIV